MTPTPRGTAAVPGVHNPIPATDRVRRAIATTAERLSEHWRGLIESRTRGHARATGSITDETRPEALREAIERASWQTYSHPAVVAPCVAFWTSDIEGVLGIVEVDLLDESTDLTLRDAHETGFVNAEVVGDYGDRAEGVCLIVGPDDEAEVIYTFHPGPPVPPSTVPARLSPGRTVTPSEAMALGLRTAKVTRPPVDSRATSQPRQ